MIAEMARIIRTSGRANQNPSISRKFICVIIFRMLSIDEEILDARKKIQRAATTWNVNIIPLKRKKTLGLESFEEMSL